MSYHFYKPHQRKKIEQDCFKNVTPEFKQIRTVSTGQVLLVVKKDRNALTVATGAYSKFQQSSAGQSYVTSVHYTSNAAGKWIA